MAQVTAEVPDRQSLTITAVTIIQKAHQDLDMLVVLPNKQKAQVMHQSSLMHLDQTQAHTAHHKVHLLINQPHLMAHLHTISLLVHPEALQQSHTTDFKTETNTYTAGVIH
jgi:UDP-3-O-[3-hydroxymyristoyl] glucosamine N-acyltransferase